jgi:TonB family protein
VTAAPPPRLTGGVIASVVFHAGFVGLFFVLGPGKPPPSPPVYSVQLFAAPPGQMSTGAVQPAPPPKAVETAPPVSKAVPKPTPKVATTKAKPAPKQATETAPKTVPKTAVAPTPAASPDSAGKGTDVANVDTHGIEFPYPYYTKNIVNSLLRYFGTQSMRLTAEVRFVIRRDGSVGSIQIVTSSRNYSFDQRVLGAVEAAANAKAFGPLPPGFNEDILPVTFRFSPNLISR